MNVWTIRFQKFDESLLELKILKANDHPQVDFCLNHTDPIHLKWWAHHSLRSMFQSPVDCQGKFRIDHLPSHSIFALDYFSEMSF